MRRTKTKSLIKIIVIFLFAPLIASDYYFYRPENNFGSDLYFNPWNMTINGSFDILRNGALQTKDLRDVPLGLGAENVWRNIRSPINSIDQYGWDDFLSREFMNFDLAPETAYFLPNIFNHIIGNGMLYVKAQEWFDYNGYRHPALLSFFMTTTYQFVNEAVENGPSQSINVDPISDLLVFNPLGILLFSFDGPKRLFSKILRVYDWSLQPMINPANYNLENAGQSYCMKIDFPFKDQFALFSYWGIHGLLGFSYQYTDNRSISVGGGGVINRIKKKVRDDSVVFFEPDVDGALGIFMDKNNSLLYSCIITGPRFYNAKINVYPNMIKKGILQPGFYLSFGELDGFIFGISLANIPIGLARGGK